MSTDVDRPEEDEDWDVAARGETPTGRLDRNWSDLLQELRVAQTGVQLLTGVLLTVPFQPRFSQLPPHDTVVYLVTVSLSVLSTGFLIAPVVLHRMLFRLHARRVLVAMGQRCAMAGFAALGLAVVGVCTLIFDAVLGSIGAWVAGVAAVVVFGALWLVGPLVLRRRMYPEDDEG